MKCHEIERLADVPVSRQAVELESRQSCSQVSRHTVRLAGRWVNVHALRQVQRKSCRCRDRRSADSTADKQPCTQTYRPAVRSECRQTGKRTDRQATAKVVRRRTVQTQESRRQAHTEVCSSSFSTLRLGPALKYWNILVSTEGGIGACHVLMQLPSTYEGRRKYVEG